MFRVIKDIPGLQYLIFMSAAWVLLFSIIAFVDFYLRESLSSPAGIWLPVWFLILVFSVFSWWRETREWEKSVGDKGSRSCPEPPSPDGA